jgi:hypothetical protein
LVSPILVRPVREQLEHDRVIRLIQAKLRRRYEAAINPGNERNTAVGSGTSAVYPDLVFHSTERGHRLQAVVEVETTESVNHLEALAEWAHFARLRVPFHLYVPAGMVEVARRLCEDNQIQVGEIWTYHGIGDQVRFTMVHRSRVVPAPLPVPRATAAATPAPRKKMRSAKPSKARATTTRSSGRAGKPVARKASRTARRK